MARNHKSHNSERPGPDPDDIRAEYAALTAYGRQVVNFRFTLLGFFLAAAGLVLGGQDVAGPKALLIAFIALVLWMLELRNRALLMDLDERAIYIERHYWHLGEHEGFVSCQHRPEQKYTRLWKWRVKCPISHSKALDLVYIAVFVYSLIEGWEYALSQLR